LAAPGARRSTDALPARRGDLQERGRDQGGVIGGAVRQSAAAATGEDLHVAAAVPGKVLSRLVSEVWPAFDADHLGGQPGQQCCLVTQAGADLKYVIAPVRSRLSIIRADSEGCVVTCPCPTGWAGRSRQP
jgi:hypothetical protein